MRFDLWVKAKSISSRKRQLTIEESFSELHVLKNQVRSIVQEFHSLTESTELHVNSCTELQRSLDEIIMLESEFKNIVERKRRKLNILEKTCDEV